MSIIAVFFMFSVLRVINSQYYGYPSACQYQPNNYYSGQPVLSSYAPPPPPPPPPYQMGYAQQLTFPTPVAMFAPTSNPSLPSSPPNTPTATAYYLTTGSKAPKTERGVENSSLPKTSVATGVEKSLSPPAYSCPFCNGFKDVPRNPKLPPPPPPSVVMPGILDKIPSIECDCKPDLSTIGLEKCKLKDKLTSCTLLSDRLQQKLKGKLRFDEDLLDGFLTGLGLKNHNT